MMPNKYKRIVRKAGPKTTLSGRTNDTKEIEYKYKTLDIIISFEIHQNEYLISNKHIRLLRNETQRQPCQVAYNEGQKSDNRSIKHTLVSILTWNINTRSSINTKRL